MLNESMCVLYMNESVVCVCLSVWGRYQSICFYSCTFWIEETTDAYDRLHHPPAQRTPVCSAAWGATDFLPPPPTHILPGSVWNWVCVFLVFRWGGGESMGVGIGAGWNDKNVLERAWSVFASLPVLTFKILSHSSDKPMRHMDSDLVCYQCALGYMQPNVLHTVWKAHPFGNLNKFVFLLQQAVQLFPNCGVGKKVNPPPKLKRCL